MLRHGVGTRQRSNQGFAGELVRGDFSLANPSAKQVGIDPKRQGKRCHRNVGTTSRGNGVSFKFVAVGAAPTAVARGLGFVSVHVSTKLLVDTSILGSGAELKMTWPDAYPPMAAWVTRSQCLDFENVGLKEHTSFFAAWQGTLTIHEGSQFGPVRLRLQADGALKQLAIHRPEGGPYLCVEPVSHVADGFNLHARGIPGTGTRVLGAGESMQGRLQISLE